MSVPPQILRIKRKREDEPVDSLCKSATVAHQAPTNTTYFTDIEIPDKRRTLATPNFFFRRVEARFAPGFPQPVQSKPLRNGIPEIIATQPGEEKTFFDRPVAARQPAPTPSSNRYVPDISHDHASTISAIPSSQLPSQPPRRFHLTTIEPVPQAATSHPSGSKQRKGLADATIAVFVEEQGLKRQQLNPTNTGPLASDTVPTAPNDGSTTPVRPRKRPGASSRLSTPTRAATRAALEPKIETDAEVDAREALLKYAEEYDAEHSTHTTPTNDHPATTANNDNDTEMTDAFVYDTYTRHPLPNPPASSSMDTYAYPSPSSLSDPTHNSIGILIIPESSSDSFFYTPSGEDSDSEGDWDSEQDDENAENYYGADYPEEEVRSDDGGEYEPVAREFGGGWGGEDDDEEGEGGGDMYGWERKKREWGWDDGGKRGRVNGSDDDVDDGDDNDGEDEDAAVDVDNCYFR